MWQSRLSTTYSRKVRWRNILVCSPSLRLVSWQQLQLCSNFPQPNKHLSSSLYKHKHTYPSVNVPSQDTQDRDRDWSMKATLFVAVVSTVITSAASYSFALLQRGDRQSRHWRDDQQQRRSQTDAFANPRFDMLRFVETLITGHRWPPNRYPAIVRHLFLCFFLSQLLCSVKLGLFSVF